MKQALLQIIDSTDVRFAEHWDRIFADLRCGNCRYFQKIDFNVVRTSHCVNSSSPTFADVVPPDFVCGKFTRAQ